MQNIFTYQDNQYISIPYKHNFIFHFILIGIGTYLFVINCSRPYINAILFMYLLFLITYLIKSVLHAKIKDKLLSICDTVWNIDSTEIKITFTITNYDDCHTIKVSDIHNIYWCAETHTIVFIYDSPEVFSFSIPFLVNVPLSYMPRIQEVLSVMHDIKPKYISYDEMVQLITTQPETETRK